MDIFSHKIEAQNGNQIVKIPSFISLNIRQSIHSPIETADITLPANSFIEKDGRRLQNSEMTANQFFEGDKITIEIGYNDELEKEFEGFITSIGVADPCKIKFEGYSYQLRKQSPRKSWENVQLRDVIAELIKGTDITIHPDTPRDFKIHGYYVGLRGWDALRELEELKNRYGLVAYFINGNKLYVGIDALAQTADSQTYSIGWNTFEEQELEYTKKKAVERRIEVTYTDLKGKKRNVSTGKMGAKTVHYKLNTLSSDEEALAIGLRKLGNTVFEGYEGRIHAKTVPYCKHGYKTIIEDDLFPERNGAYLCDEVELRIGDGYDTRVIHVGRKLSN